MSGESVRRPMKLAALAEASAALAATSSRSEKIRLLSRCLLQLAPEERETGVAWLSGNLPQGRLGFGPAAIRDLRRSEEHTSELQSLMRISYAVFCLKTKTK